MAAVLASSKDKITTIVFISKRPRSQTPIKQARRNFPIFAIEGSCIPRVGSAQEGTSETENDNTFLWRQVTYGRTLSSVLPPTV